MRAGNESRCVEGHFCAASLLGNGLADLESLFSFCFMIHGVGCSVGICTVDLLAQKDVESSSFGCLYGSPYKHVQSSSSMLVVVEISQKLCELKSPSCCKPFSSIFFPSFSFFSPEELLRIQSYKVCDNDTSLTKWFSALFLGRNFIFILNIEPISWL